MPNVLVVDDIVTDRLLAGGLFENEPDWAVQYANNGIEALQRITDRAPDVVITDMMMPEMNGLELVEAVIKDNPHIPVVLMTSQGSEEIAVKALETGAASYVPKRILGNELLRTVSRIVQSAREEQSRSELLNQMSRTESIEFGYNLPLISSVVSHLIRSMVAFGVCGQTESMRAGTALDEAMMNAYYHGNLEMDSSIREDGNDRYFALARQRCQEPEYRDRRIKVEARLASHEVSVTICDEGSGFQPAALPDPTAPEFICRPYGRGVMLMRTFMDEVRFNEIGNEVTLVKQRRTD